MFNKNLKKRKNRIKRLRSLRSFISRKCCSNGKVEKHQKEVELLVNSIR